MRLNRVETALMNNPVRSSLQSHSVATLLERLGGTTVDQSIIEIGCGYTACSSRAADFLPAADSSGP